MLRKLPVPRPVLEIISDSTIMLPNDFRKPLGFVVEFIMLLREITGDWSGAGVEACHLLTYLLVETTPPHLDHHITPSSYNDRTI